MIKKTPAKKAVRGKSSTKGNFPAKAVLDYREPCRGDAEGLDFECLPGPENRKLITLAGEPVTLSAEESRQCWIQTFNIEARQQMYAKPERVTVVVNGEASRDKGEVRGVALTEFTVDDVQLLFDEIRGRLHKIDKLAKWHPDQVVWKAACRVMADIAFLVLRNRPESASLQKPFQQLWIQEQSDFCHRWDELAKPGERTKESLETDPVRRVLYNAVMTVMGYYGQHVLNVARFITDPDALDDLLKCQALCFERPFEVLENGLRVDQFSLWVKQFLVETPGFIEGGPYRFKHWDRLRRLPFVHLDRFEKTVVRPYLTEGGTNSVWKREVAQILKQHGQRPFPASHAKTMKNILERDFVLQEQVPYHAPPTA